MSRDVILQSLRSSRSENKHVFTSIPSTENIFNSVESEDPALLFQQKLTALKGEYLFAQNGNELSKLLENLTEGEGDHQFLVQPSALLSKILYHSLTLQKRLVQVRLDAMDHQEMERYRGGITHCELLVAQTGSVVLSSSRQGGRRLSILPPLHIVVAEKKQIVNSFEEVMQRLEKKKDLGSYVRIISGPSRTADIEKNLVLGAHGPKRLVVILSETNQFEV